MTDDIKQSARTWIGDHRADLSAWHSVIWDLAEPAWREYESAAWYMERLREEGFEVEAGSGGMPTAFSATWRNGAGPTLLGYAEYDAVPGNCQAASTVAEPRKGLSRFAPGHTDPHSALGIGALGGFLAAKHAMQRHGIGGTLRFMGEPAEKVQGSKVVHGLCGYYDNVDAIISFHPFYMLPLCNTVRWDTHCGAYYSRIYTFTCDNPETWDAAAAGSPIPASHSAARAPGANAALATMLTLARTSQDAMAPAVGGWSLTDAVLTAGQATADNLPAGLAQVQYSWRTPDISTAEQVLRVLDSVADAAARATHCRLATRWVARNRPGLANHAMAEVTYANLASAGPPAYGPAAVGIAQQIQHHAGFHPDEHPFLPECEQLIEPREAERRLRELLPAWQANWTSDDYVEMTWYAPTVRLYVGRPALAGGRYPAWVMNALGGIPETIDPTVLCAARTISGTVLDLLRSPVVLAKARSEFELRRSGGPGPLLPAGFRAPVDYRWPEYVETARGRDWWIPANEEF
jgi:aminobenzoyl-glutamate utilization protein B